MAKYRVLFICLFGLFCFTTLTSGQEYAPDPSLEEIKKMDAQEGLPRDFIPQKDLGNSGEIVVDPSDGKGTYDNADVTDTRRVSSRLKEVQTINGNRDKDLKKRHIVEKGDEKAKSWDAKGGEYTNQQEISLPIEEEIGDNMIYKVDPGTDLSKDYFLDSENSERNEKIINIEEHELNIEQNQENEESELNDEADETDPTGEGSIQHTEGETKMNTQPVLELNEDDEHMFEEILDPKEEEFEILNEENEPENEAYEPEPYFTENNENGDAEPDTEEEETETETENEEEEMEHYVIENNDNGGVEPEMKQEQTETEKEDNSSEDYRLEVENQTEKQVSNSENEEVVYDKEVVPNAQGLDSNVDVPQFLTDFHLVQKDPEVDINSFPAEKMDPACHLPPVTGFCKASFRRFYFNSKMGECQTFIYGGCGGNENNFETIEDCMQTCSQVKV